MKPVSADSLAGNRISKTQNKEPPIDAAVVLKTENLHNN